MELDPLRSISEQLAELEPYELKYLRGICKMLQQAELPRSSVPHDSDFEPFDPDELGIDPEEDEEYW